VEVAVEVEVMEPVVSWPIDEEAKKELTKRPMVANSEVEVALVERRFGKVEVEVVVAVNDSATTPPAPTTESGAYGTVVAIPNFPSARYEFPPAVPERKSLVPTLFSILMSSDVPPWIVKVPKPPDKYREVSPT